MLKSWIQGILAASVLSALAQQITPSGPVRKVTAFVCGITLLGVLLSPVAEADRVVFSQSLSEYRSTVAELTQDLASQEKQLLRLYIEQQTSAYILDEARMLGIDGLEAAVQAKWGDESWVPYEVVIRGEASSDQMIRMRSFLEAELGIPPERQRWDE